MSLLCLFASGGAPASIVGASLAVFLMAGSATGTHGVSGSSLRPFTLAGHISGVHGVSGRSSKAFTLQGSVHGSFTAPSVTGSSIVALRMGGSAVGYAYPPIAEDPNYLLTFPARTFNVEFVSRSHEIALLARDFTVIFPARDYEVSL